MLKNFKGALKYFSCNHQMTSLLEFIGSRTITAKIFRTRQKLAELQGFVAHFNKRFLSSPVPMSTPEPTLRVMTKGQEVRRETQSLSPSV